ncbi:RDD family protein [Microbacterium yannicii]|uniref:RDD family protein n=1 Tax=Microbacterium yannicii TaxID=671622 RepID=UPI0002FEB542|nr:RDD family protein [Microbacterium yannicii]
MIWEIDEQARRIEGLDEHGRARPEYAASLGLVAAPFGRRALSATIEVAVYLVLLLPLLIGALPALLGMALAPTTSGVTGGDLILVIVFAAISSALTSAFVIVQLILHGRRGVTLGKALTGLRSVNVRTLERPGFWRGAVLRALVLWASFALPLLGPLLVIALSPFFDPERRGRGWADLAGATWLVDARDGLNPYDAKRMRIARKTAATDLADVRSELPSLATPVDHRGATAYIPTSRSSGGVLGAQRGDAGAGAASADQADPPAPAVAPVAPPSVVPQLLTPAAAPALAPSASVSVGAPSDVSTGSGGSGWVPPRLLPEADDAAAAPEAARVAPASVAAPPAAHEPNAHEPSAPRGSVVLTLDDGRTIDITGAGILLGRDPALPAGAPPLTPVAIDDQTKSVSKTHLAILRSGAAVTIIDLGSTNGSGVVRDGDEHTLAPQEQFALRAGDTIRLGDRHARIRIG